MAFCVPAQQILSRDQRNVFAYSVFILYGEFYYYFLFNVFNTTQSPVLTAGYDHLCLLLQLNTTIINTINGECVFLCFLSE